MKTQIHNRLVPDPSLDHSLIVCRLGWPVPTLLMLLVVWSLVPAAAQPLPWTHTTNNGTITITGAPGMAVAVEGCIDLANPVWIPLGTYVLADGKSPFADATSANHPSRYYRFRLP